MKHVAISSPETHKVGFRPHLSEENKIYVPAATNFSAPNSPVIRRSWLPLPTMSLKNCGPKYANAV